MSHEISNDVYFESREDGLISCGVLNRGAKRNAISPTLALTLLEVLDKALTDQSHVFLLRSNAPGVFCAGFDINYVGTKERDEGIAAMYACIAAIEGAAKVTISFADGFVLGGGNELFLAADLRLATPTSEFQITSARLGAVYSYLGTSRFVHLIGATAATELLLAAQKLSAEEALRVGLVTRIVPDEAAALAYCRQVASLAPLAQQAMKATLKQIASTNVPPRASEKQWAHLQSLRAAADSSEDRLEGKRAFIEKRKPKFKGR